jgi:hypothetical protein
MENNIVWIAKVIQRDNDWVSEKFRVFSTERNATDWAIKRTDTLKAKDQFGDTFDWEVYALTLDDPDA